MPHVTKERCRDCKHLKVHSTTRGRCYFEPPCAPHDPDKRCTPNLNDMACSHFEARLPTDPEPEIIIFD